MLLSVTLLSSHAFFFFSHFKDGRPATNDGSRLAAVWTACKLAARRLKVPRRIHRFESSAHPIAYIGVAGCTSLIPWPRVLRLGKSAMYLSAQCGLSSPVQARAGCCAAASQQPSQTVALADLEPVLYCTQASERVQNNHHAPPAESRPSPRARGFGCRAAYE